MYYNSLNLLYKKYEKGSVSSVKAELLRGIERLNIWIVSISPKIRRNINVIDFVLSENVRLETALRIFNDSSKIGMFKTVYKYRDETGTVIASSCSKNRLLDYLVMENQNDSVVLIPELIEKSYILTEETNKEFESADMTNKVSNGSESEQYLTQNYIKNNVQNTDIYDYGSEDF